MSDAGVVTELVEELQKAGVHLWEESNRLRFRAPKGVMTQERQAALRAHRDIVLDHLRHRDSTAATPSSQVCTDPFPLTDVQNAYLLGRSEAFHYGGVPCHGYGELAFPELDPGRIQDAWRKLVLRHEMLRTVIDLNGTQRVLEHVPDFQLEVVDLTKSGIDIQAIREQMSHRVYQSDVWPMFDLKISRACGLDVLHFSIDFLIVDFVSTQILLDELLQLYEAEEPLPPIDLSFRDYVLATRKLLGGDRYERDRAYWLELVDSLPPAPDLPVLDREPAARFSRSAASLPPDEWRALRAAAGAHGITASVAILAAYAEVIARWCHSPRFTLNLTLQNRMSVHPHSDRIVGDFTGVELLAVEPAKTLADRARAMHARLWEDLDHRRFSGLELMREAARRRGQGAGLYPVVFTSAIGVDSDADRRRRGLGDLVNGITQTPQVWIDCQVSENRGALAFNWDVRGGVFPDGLVDDMFSAFTSLIKQMAAQDDVWEAEDPVTAPSAQLERRRQVNSTEGPLPDSLLHEGVVAQALRTPDRLAVADPHGSLTYGQLLGRAISLAEELRGEGPIVAVLIEKGRDQFAAVLGVLLAGLAYLPLETDQPAARRERILRDAGVRCAVTNSGAELPVGVRRVDLGRLVPAPLPATQLPRRAAIGDLAYVIYTSGSTGAPKGVMISHLSAVNTIEDINRRFDVVEHDRVLGLAALGFDLSVYDMFGPPARGAALILPSHSRRTDPSHWTELIHRYRVTLWNSVPTHLQMLQEYLSAIGEQVSTLRLALLSGDWIPVRLPDQVRAKVPGLRIISLGGATEAAIWSISHHIDEVPPQWRSIPYGKPLTNQAFHVLDTNLRHFPDWVAGDLYIGGVGLALGYLGDPQKTAERFICHPELGRLYRTGDLGRYLPDGSIEFLGREDRQVKLRGHRIELAEIEAAAGTCDGVAAAVALADPGRGLAVFAEVAKRRVTESDGEEKQLRAGPRQKSLRSDLAEAVAADVTAVADPQRYRQHAEALDQAALLSMANALAVTRGAGDYVPASRGRLMRRWLRALESAGLAAPDAISGELTETRQVSPDKLEDAWRRAEDCNVDDPRLISYFRATAKQLPALLLGAADPLLLLFPEGSLSVCEGVYAGPLAVRWANRAAAALVRQIEPRRLLEVGAGTGATTAEMLAAMPNVSYTFTDISPLFIRAARDRFASSPDVRFAVLDVEQDYRAFGFLPNSYDVIVAGDVLHAVSDVPAALTRLRELLAPDGWLVLTEVTRDHYSFMTSVEFLLQVDFTDMRRDSDEIFLTERQWQEMLTQAGAGPVLCMPTASGTIVSESGIRVFAAQFKRDRAPLETSNLAAHLEEQLPDYMLPSHLQLVDAMPLTPNGKIDVNVLKTWLPPLITDRATAPEDASELEKILMTLWAEVLDLKKVDRHQGFLVLGGESLLAARLVGRMREMMSLSTPFDTLLQQVLEGPTVAELAAWMAQAKPADNEIQGASGDADRARSVVRRLGGDGVGPVCVLVHDGSGTLACYDPYLAQLCEIGPVVGLEIVDRSDYLARDPAHVIERMADDYAEALLDAECLSVTLVGERQGAVLAVEVARRLAEAGAGVHQLVLIEPSATQRPDDPLSAHMAAALACFQVPAYAGDITLVLADEKLVPETWQRACLGDVRVVGHLIDVLR